MRIIIRSKDVNMRLPVPLALADAAVRFLPEAVVEDLRKSVPAPYGEVITKELLQSLVRECRMVLKEYKGLEIVHVEAGDGTFVSIRL
nr:hypothetical protein [uncultured Eisenbergiella sp.]